MRISLLLLIASAAAAADPSAFDQNVRPILMKTCAGCHSEQVSSGGVNLAPYSAFSSIAEHPDDWQKILQKVRTGEMPPKGIPKPSDAQIAGFVKTIQDELDR